MSTNAPTDHESIDSRTERALTEYLTVLDDYGRAADADGLFMVVSQSGEEYLVDSRSGACECPDAEHRHPEGGCKHVRRVAFATGDRPIPAGVEGVDPQLGEHVDGPTIAAAGDAALATDGGILVAGDDAEVLDARGDVQDANERPDECECGGFHHDADLPCWPCYREGFETVAGDVGGDR